MASLATLTVGEVVALQHLQAQSGESLATSQVHPYHIHGKTRLRSAGH